MATLISWNVNGIRACTKKGFLDWLKDSDADIVAIQETKANPEQLEPTLLEPAAKNGQNYHAYWASALRGGYSGVAIFTKKQPLSISFLGDPRFDSEGRVLVAKYESYSLINAYFPNSQENGARLDYKLAFCEQLFLLCKKLVQQGETVIVSGDYNIAHKKIDLARPDTNENSAGFLPEERAWMDSFLDTDFVDTFRLFNKDPGNYTWWTYRVPKARENNIGWRLDYHCINVAAKARIINAGICKAIEGSDHCPVTIEIKD